MSSSPAPSATDLDSQPSDPGYRSRSQSRRSRRRKQSKNAQKNPQNRKDAAALPSVAEEDQQQQSQKKQPSQSTMQPFEHIGPDETSMDGPVTHARAQRGEIPMREGNPKQALATGKGEKKQESKMMDQDGLKLRLELNLDVEIELKASIKGDITIALL